MDIRNRIVRDVGIPALEKQGFKRSPFSTSLYGWNNIQGYIYYLCRITDDSNLEDIEIQVMKGDKWIKTRLNIFRLQPDIQSLKDLERVDGLQYKLPPNSLTEFRFRDDDIKGLLLFHFRYWRGHKLNRFYTESGLSRSIKRLSKNIETDYMNVDYFIRKWHELHKPLTTTWTGQQIPNTSVTSL